MPPGLKKPIENFINYQYQSTPFFFQGGKNFCKTLLLLMLSTLTCVFMVWSCLHGFLIQACYQLWIIYPVPYHWWGYYQQIKRRAFWKIVFRSINQDQYLVPFLCVLCALPWFYLFIRYVLPTLVGIILWVGVLAFDSTPLGV